MDRVGTLYWISLLLVIIGGLNWGLIGFFNFNLVESIFGTNSAFSNIIYDLVGISAIYLAVASTTKLTAE
jgi:uncharacterized membrane protein YuzA (DUF378 family)